MLYNPHFVDWLNAGHEPYIQRGFYPVLLASGTCGCCRGWGYVDTRRRSKVRSIGVGAFQPCDCTYRAAWARVWIAHQQLAHRLTTPERHWAHFADVDYLADVTAMVRRVLAGHPDLAELFDQHYRRGLTVTELARRAGVHPQIIRRRLEPLQTLLGHEAVHMRPFPLYPHHRYSEGDRRP